MPLASGSLWAPPLAPTWDSLSASLYQRISYWLGTHSSVNLLWHVISLSAHQFRIGVYDCTLPCGQSLSTAYLGYDVVFVRFPVHFARVFIGPKSRTAHFIVLKGVLVNTSSVSEKMLRADRPYQGSLKTVTRSWKKVSTYQLGRCAGFIPLLRRESSFE